METSAGLSEDCKMRASPMRPRLSDRPVGYSGAAITYFLLLIAAYGLLTAGCSTTQSFGSQLDDTGISAQVRALLIQDTAINAVDIRVVTDEEEVFLIGRVGSREESLRAEGHARAIDGVWSVINLLKIGVAHSSPTSGDQKLRQAIEERILRDQSVLGLNVQVIVYEGEVYLLGRVASDNERQQAVGVAKETEGVVRVLNYLKAGKTRRIEPKT